MRDTPQDCRSDRTDIDLCEFSSDISKYALNTLTLPYWCAMLLMPLATEKPSTLAGSSQFSTCGKTGRHGT